MAKDFGRLSRAEDVPDSMRLWTGLHTTGASLETSEVGRTGSFNALPPELSGLVLDLSYPNDPNQPQS